MILALFSCAGYRFQEKSNPFERYGIRSIQIPMFYNNSALPNVSAQFTREFKVMLYKYQGLKIQSSNSAGVDAVLIGIIDSPASYSSTVANQTLRVANAVDGEGRREFYVPSSSRVTINLRVILIKNPTAKEIKILQSEFGKYIDVDSRIIINQQIPLQEAFNRELYVGSSGDINYTQNQGAIKSTVDLLAIRATESFRSLILNVF